MNESSSIFFEIQEKEKILYKKNCMATLEQKRPTADTVFLPDIELSRVKDCNPLQLKVFEELVWGNLFPILSVCYQHLLNVDDYTRVIIHIFKNMILVSAQFPDALQMPLYASLNALLGFTGLAGTQPIIQGERGAVVVASIIKMMKSSLLRLKPVWKDLFSFVGKLKIYFPELSNRYFSAKSGSMTGGQIRSTEEVEDGGLMLFSAIPKNEILDLYGRDFHRLDTESQTELFKVIAAVCIDELADISNVCLSTFDSLWSIIHHNDKVFNPVKYISFWDSLTQLVVYIYQNAVSKGPAWSEPLQREVTDKVMSLLKKVLSVSRSVGDSVDSNKKIFEALYRIHKAKNDPRYSETLIDTSLDSYVSSNSPHFNHGWLFLAKSSMDIVNNSSLSWRTPVKQKILSVALFFSDTGVEEGHQNMFGEQRHIPSRDHHILEDHVYEETCR